MESNSSRAGIIGVLGGGQLAKMLGLEAYRLGLGFAVIENGYDSPAGMMTKLDFGKGWNDKEELDAFISSSTFITLENEFIDPDILSYIEKTKPVFPSSTTMRLVRDKYIQKKTFRNKGLATTDFAKLENEDSATSFADEHGYPFIIKSREMGYDGYGNYTIRTKDDITKAFAYFKEKKPGIELMAEAFVDFKKELAVMAVRSFHGEEVTYPCVETIQKNHICHTVTAPSNDSQEISSKAREMAIECVRSINGVGIFGVELFLTNSGELLVNEIAPRPHNSGHYTIEACQTSQFENCIRAVTGLPLGSTDMRTESAVMVNILGDADGGPIPKGINEMMKIPEAKLHLYGKTKSRNGRKMGHLTVIGDDPGDILNKATKAADFITWQ